MTNDPIQSWDPERYAAKASFVPALALDLLPLLRPVRGERILDLGCGDGSLTERLTSDGANVVGVDASPAMIDAARARGLDARLITAETLAFTDEFDGVFSNAMLHWTRDIDAVLAGVHRALRRGGRFVGEFGGAGNVNAIVSAARSALAARGWTFGSLWYFPSSDEFSSALERHGFVVEMMTLFERPTPLPDGITGWLEIFGGPLLAPVPASERSVVAAEIQQRLAPTNRDKDGRWFADYVRLRFVARRPA